MKDYDPNTASSYLIYLMYWDVSYLYERAMPQNFPVDGFKRKNKKSKFTQIFIQNLDDDIN